ncbi:hypothetical protein M426DRAFT_324814 [Hypoxylon sp. CI-4A]|nr:hypothetical protein M426DRAFT_324814 [Hypoxylon sp. CI-4A]
MKILCLHGERQSGQTFQSELKPLLDRLQAANREVSFEFTDGPLKCSNQTTKDSSPPTLPEYNFYEAEQVDDIRRARKWLSEKLDRDGPYDGVLAHSQGAALASSFLLYRQWYEHEQPPPFKFAIFTSGSIPLAVLRDLGVAVSSEAEEAVAQARRRHAELLAPLPAHLADARRAVFNSDDCFGLNLNKIPPELKIRIPTVHAWGGNDALFPAAVQLAGLCDPYIRKMFTHPGARGMELGEKELDELATLVDWCVQRATWPGQTQ